MRLSVVLFALLVPLAVEAGEIYQYKDAQGRTVYSDVPPPDAKNVTRSSVAPASEGSPAARRTLAERERDLRKQQADRDQADQKAAKDKADAEARSRNCEDARGYLRTLESGERVVRHDANGERSFLDDEQRAADIARTKKAIQDFCK
ncbi:MAG: DUF4124 domain-containing protein [Rhodocyclaceae bacterium]|nr:DUF4124 domain-containing protein [Rhodocyclaceae bacterium]MBX3667163.1 DUF4124 domain-containing protein [Rhodocyclaceae bacterium]